MTDEERQSGFTSDVNMTRDANRRARAANDNPWTRLVFGLTLLTVGVLAWLDHQGQINASDYFHWWPLVLLGLAVAHLPQRRWWGAFVWFMLSLMFMPRLPMFPHLRLGMLLGLWPLLISAAGMTLVLQALKPMAKDASNSGAFRAFAWMGGSGRTIGSDDFVGGDAVAIMGACELNLADARITSEAVIDVLAFWGGIEIRVPQNWIIENRVTALLGGIRNHATNATSGDGPRLIIRGSAIMGGIEIRNSRGLTA